MGRLTVSMKTIDNHYGGLCDFDSCELKIPST